MSVVEADPVLPELRAAEREATERETAVHVRQQGEANASFVNVIARARDVLLLEIWLDAEDCSGWSVVPANDKVPGVIVTARAAAPATWLELPALKAFVTYCATATRAGVRLALLRREGEPREPAPGASSPLGSLERRIAGLTGAARDHIDSAGSMLEHQIFSAAARQLRSACDVVVEADLLAKAREVAQEVLDPRSPWLWDANAVDLHENDRGGRRLTVNFNPVAFIDVDGSWTLRVPHLIDAITGRSADVNAAERDVEALLRDHIARARGVPRRPRG